MTVSRRHMPTFASYAVFLLLYAGGAALYADKGFLGLGVFLNLFSDNAFLGVVAIGMTFVILSGGIDLSVGAVMSLSSMVVGVLVMQVGWPPFATMLAALLMGAILGLGMGCIIQFLEIKPFIVTLAGMFFARGLGYIIHLESIGIEHPQQTWLASLELPLGGGYFLPIPAIVFMVVALAGCYASRYTSFGRNVFALGGNEEAALLMGLPVGRTRIGVYALSGFCSALGGIVLTLYLCSGSHTEGVALELDAIAAVVIGGTLLTGGVGSVAGTVSGVLIVGVILNIMTFEARGSGENKIAIATLLLVFVLMQRLITRAGTRGVAGQSTSAPLEHSEDQ